MTRLLRRLRLGEDGVTIPEVAVTTLLLGIVMTIAFQFLDQSASIVARTEAHSTAEDDAQRTLRIVTEELRGAFPVGAACTTAITTSWGSVPAGYDNCVQFTVPRSGAGLNPCPKSEIVYALVGSAPSRRLVEKRMEYAGTTSCPATPASTRERVLLDKVANTSAQPLLTWLRGDGSVINTSTAAAEVPKASSVQVTLYSTYRNNAKTLSFSSVAALRNNINR